jgi:hypothetical protein
MCKCDYFNKRFFVVKWDAVDIVLAGFPAAWIRGYPANPKAGYQISGRIFGC